MERIVAHREQPLPSLKQACPAVPPWLDMVFRKMVAKRPEDRCPSVTAFFSDMDRRAAPKGVWGLPVWLVLVAAIVLIDLLASGIGMLLPAIKHRTVPVSQQQKNSAELPAPASIR